MGTHFKTIHFKDFSGDKYQVNRLLVTTKKLLGISMAGIVKDVTTNY